MYALLRILGEKLAQSMAYKNKQPSKEYVPSF